ncbi:unnamed protein product [Moneuplotes crassus]|uniref:RING-type domain-containing protein n=3 Tax=Euplotes crassus TaxID=5936 RepID=A0AAD2D8Z1_EUPCR|nr:unnamed protein product [Moneuplotes crassus]
MSGTDSNRDLISKILQESDDEEEDELDRIIYANIRKSGKGTDVNIDKVIRKDIFNPGRMETTSTEPEASGSTLATSMNRMSYLSKNKKKKDDFLVDQMLKEFDNESSSEEDFDVDALIKKEKKKDEFEKDLQNKLNINFSDSSEDDDDEMAIFREKLGKEQERKDEQEEQRAIEQAKRMSLLEIVETNESKTEEQKSYAVLQYDKNYYNIHTIEKKLLHQQRLTKIAENIYSKRLVKTELEGLPYCIKQYQNLIFVGISQGLIRIFDDQTDEELKPLVLKKNKVVINRVLSMDVSLNGEYLVAGYADGNIALFDLTKNKLIIEINDVHHHEIKQVAFLSIDSPITIMSGDDKGILYKITISRTFYLYSYKSDLVMKKPFKEFCSLSALQPYKKMPREVADWHTHNIVAFSNTEELNVAVLGGSPRKLFSSSRNEFAQGFVEHGHLCYTDWGYGITPRVSREKSKCLLAVAWGKVLQIYILENPDKGMSGIKADGYYISDSVIDCVYFVSDSIVMILVNKKEARVLYIPHFLPNSFGYEGHKIMEESAVKSQEVNKAFSKKKNYGRYKKSPGEESLREHSQKSELESGATILEGNIRYSIVADKQNFNNTITVNENKIIVLGQDKILSAKLFHWEDYLKFIQKQCDWLVCLKIALDIYHGEIKGYYGVPYIKEERERLLQHKMMDLISEGIKSMIKNFKKNDNESPSNSNYSADIIAIKAAVEFCNRIGCLNFLFTGIIKLFTEENLEDRFIENLEPFILNGHFKDAYLPDIVLKKLCDFYFDNQKFHNFERIVSKINFSHYVYFDQLQTICKEKMLTTALIHLIISSTLGREKKACLQILNNVYNRFKQADKKRTLDEVKEILLKDDESKFGIEASYEYIGIKLMYIIKLFIKGEKFPSGKLSKIQRIEFLGQSIEFLLREEESTELMRLNARTFFSVVSELFLNPFIAETLLKCNDEDNCGDDEYIPFSHPKIVDILHGHILTIQDQDFIKFEYSYFIIKIADSDYCKENAYELSAKVYSSVINILKECIKYNKKPKVKDPIKVKRIYVYSGPEGMDPEKTENEVLRVIKFYTSTMDVSELDDIIELAEQLKFDKLKIHLYEQKQDFQKCIMIFLESRRVNKKEIFNWLTKLAKKKDKKKEHNIEDLKNKISEVIEELVNIDPTSTGNIIDEWLPDKQKDVILKLGKNPKLQLQYLESYLKEREEDIIEKFAASSLQSKTSQEAVNYKNYLIQHVELLARNNDPKLIEIVKRNYYPLGCLDRVSKSSSTLVQEAKAHLKKREGMYSDSIKIFLELLKNIPHTSLEEQILASGANEYQKEHILSFFDIFEEICDNLRLHSKRNKNQDEIWVETLKALFFIRNNFQEIESKNDLINPFVYTKISEYMQLMSEYVDFTKIIDVSLEIDRDITYKHAKSWFNSLYISKNDQELLYTSAKKLLSNENCALIQTIIEKNNVGFVGEKDKQICSLCKNLLGSAVDQAFILTQCLHQFHYKCFFEDLKNRRINEGVSNVKAECPICKTNDIEISKQKKRESIRGRRRGRNRKRRQSSIEEETVEESEDEFSNHPLMEQRNNFSQFNNNYNPKNTEMYKQRLAAFDDDFASSQLDLMIG